jgi:L-ascorbate metabolism protein UlaG (beta-lactamase superfamily)
MLSDAQAAEIGKVDILLAPVGGNFTIDTETADAVIEKLKPAVVLPMHFCNDRCPDFPVAGIDSFTDAKTNVTVMDTSEIEYRAEELPESTSIVVLKPAK